MDVVQVIDFLRDAKEKTYDLRQKMHLANAIETLWRMKECRCFS